MHWSDARDLVRKWREDNERKSEELIEIWEDILRENVHKLGDEQYLILEQVCVGALDCNRMDIAGDCLQDLSKHFPGSLRVHLLQALHLEAVERYDEALTLLDSIIRRDETNPAPRKRKVAIMRARCNYQEAIKELTEYLKKFMVDQEAWQELCDLYLIEQDYAKAAFCMEELILHNPHNHLFHQRLAEIKFTQGGLENFEIAKSYYAQALKLNPDNMRALYGLYITMCNIYCSPKCPSSKKKDAGNLMEWALNEVRDRYKQAKMEKKLASIEAMMSGLQINTPS
ncbi:ER membrane protein complex subunit 2-A-like [Cimex lectularius]|uniref:ER membrane protein complex subunit 2 n=1 Tax=Cimex lectularius TaxID=79782 RepID=A0A8I6R5Z9_CIMLE|nr:ER membrane protein complex subunit 2-A-like [Cimex lectularius]